MYKVLKDFLGSPDGCRVIAYKKGDVLTVGTDFSSSLAKVGMTEGWVTKYLVDPGVPPKKKAKKAKEKPDFKPDLPTQNPPKVNFKPTK